MKKGRGSRDFVFPQISGRFPVSAKAWESEEVFGFRSAAKKVGSRHQIPNPTQQQQGETQNLARAVKTWKYRPPPSPQCKCLQIIPLSRTNGRVQWQAYKREQMPSVISIRFIQSISSSSSCFTTASLDFNVKCWTIHIFYNRYKVFEMDRGCMFTQIDARITIGSLADPLWLIPHDANTSLTPSWSPTTANDQFSDTFLKKYWRCNNAHKTRFYNGRWQFCHLQNPLPQT